jgi:hypothetical protein
VPGQFLWNLGAYRPDSADDILLLGTQINGFGYFDNAGTTRRQGSRPASPGNGKNGRLRPITVSSTRPFWKI